MNSYPIYLPKPCFMEITGKHYEFLKGSNSYLKAFPAFPKLHYFIRIVSNLLASFISIAFLTLFSDCYSPLKHPHIR